MLQQWSSCTFSVEGVIGHELPQLLELLPSGHASFKPVQTPQLFGCQSTFMSYLRILWHSKDQTNENSARDTCSMHIVTNNIRGDNGM